MSFVPAHIRVGSPDAPHTALVLHGILGSAQNFQGFLRKLQQALPEWQFVICDVRGHGRSQGATPPHTLQACADDLQRLCEQLGIAPGVLIGHSFGGKVCLQFAQSHGAGLQQLWLLDSNPGLVQLDPGGEVRTVIAAARAVMRPIAKRSEVHAAMLEHGLTERIASWMSTNLRLVRQHYEWTLDFDVVDELLADYCRLDFWPYLQQSAEQPRVHWVVGELSDRINSHEFQRARSLQPQARVRAHLLSGAGHWVHVDNPGELIALLVAHLPH